MKTTIFLSFWLILLAACSRPCPPDQQDLVDRQEGVIDSLQEEMAEVVLLAKIDTIKKYLEMRKKEKEQWEKELAQSQLRKLDLGMIPYFHQNGVKYNFQMVPHVKALDPNVTVAHWTESVLMTLGVGYGHEAEIVKAQLALPGVADELFEENKEAIDSIVTEWGMQPMLRGMAHGMMPFLEQKIPKAREEAFQAFFDKYGDSHGIPRNNSEWKGMKEEFRLTEQELNIEYKAWLFVKRRQKDGLLVNVVKAAKWVIAQF